MKTYKIKLFSPDMNYYYSSDKVLSEEDKERIKRIQDELCSLINLAEIGVRNSKGTSVVLKKTEDYVEVEICGDDIEIKEECELPR